MRKTNLPGLKLDIIQELVRMPMQYLAAEGDDPTLSNRLIQVLFKLDMATDKDRIQTVLQKLVAAHPSGSSEGLRHFHRTLLHLRESDLRGNNCALLWRVIASTFQGKH